VATFRAHPWVEDALLLRRCDDTGKDPDREVPDPERFRVLLERVVARRQATAEDTA
jgi:predicted HD phosphohydrolase